MKIEDKKLVIESLGDLLQKTAPMVVALGDDNLWWTVKNGAGVIYYSTEIEALRAANDHNIKCATAARESPAAVLRHLSPHDPATCPACRVNLEET
jgi:hypothetical protein